MGRWLTLAVALLVNLCADALPPQRHDCIFILPSPKGVVIDGDLRDWDMSASIESAFDEALRPRFTIRIAFMFDAQAFYIGAHFVDDTPMLNRHDPNVEPNRGWDGDALQVRLCSDPTAPYPLPNSNSDRICHLTIPLKSKMLSADCVGREPSSPIRATNGLSSFA